MIRAIAIDDEPLALEVIDAFCSKIDVIDLQMKYTETGEAKRYLDKHPVDLLFLDIMMPAINGMDFYKSVGKNRMVIFTTAYSEYALEGFNLNAVDYLLKPFEFARFKQAVDKAYEYQRFMTSRDETPSHIFIRADYNLVKVELNEITHIEGLDNYVKIHFLDKKPLLVRISLKAMEEKLPAEGFTRVHRSFIIALDKIGSVRNKIICLKDNKEIPVGINYAEKVSRLFK